MALAEKLSLTAKQQRFVEEYLIDLNATRAAIRAGFNRSSARSQGSRLRRVPHVAKAIQEAMDCRSRRTAINQDRVLEELAAIAFADIQDYLRFGPSGEVYFDWSKLPEGATRAVAEITQDEYSEGRGSEAREVKKTRFKLHNKIPALEKIGQHLGMFAKPGEKAGRDRPSEETKESSELSDIERAQRILALLDRVRARRAGQTAHPRKSDLGSSDQSGETDDPEPSASGL